MMKKNLHGVKKCGKKRLFFLNSQLLGNRRLWIETYSGILKKLYPLD